MYVQTEAREEGGDSGVGTPLGARVIEALGEVQITSETLRGAQINISGNQIHASVSACGALSRNALGVHVQVRGSVHPISTHLQLRCAAIVGRLDVVKKPTSAHKRQLGCVVMQSRPDGDIRLPWRATATWCAVCRRRAWGGVWGVCVAVRNAPLPTGTCSRGSTPRAPSPTRSPPGSSAPPWPGPRGAPLACARGGREVRESFYLLEAGDAVVVEVADAEVGAGAALLRRELVIR